MWVMDAVSLCDLRWTPESPGLGKLERQFAAEGVGTMEWILLWD